MDALRCACILFTALSVSHVTLSQQIQTIDSVSRHSKHQRNHHSNKHPHHHRNRGNHQANSDDITSDHWTEWATWSPCTQTCGFGISVRTRQCMMNNNHHKHRRSDSGEVWSSDCAGLYKETQTCNTQLCPSGIPTSRESQCSEFDGKAFMGRQYQWEPFINPKSKCELTCRAKGFRFYARLAATVADGTPCLPGDKDVCIAGLCKTVGCDGMVGSDARLDMCGRCRGDNSTCDIMSGTFKREKLERGYNTILEIPTGATNINVTELRSSSNLLALRIKNGEYFLNGPRLQSSIGEYFAAGTKFTYNKNDENWCQGQCIHAQGPINQSIVIQILYYYRNPGLRYQYSVPKNSTYILLDGLDPGTARRRATDYGSSELDSSGRRFVDNSRVIQNDARSRQRNIHNTTPQSSHNTNRHTQHHGSHVHTGSRQSFGRNFPMPKYTQTFIFDPKNILRDLYRNSHQDSSRERVDHNLKITSSHGGNQNQDNENSREGNRNSEESGRKHHSYIRSTVAPETQARSNRRLPLVNPAVVRPTPAFKLQHNQPPNQRRHFRPNQELRQSQTHSKEWSDTRIKSQAKRNRHLEHRLELERRRRLEEGRRQRLIQERRRVEEERRRRREEENRQSLRNYHQYSRRHRYHNSRSGHRPNIGRHNGHVQHNQRSRPEQLPGRHHSHSDRQRTPHSSSGEQLLQPPHVPKHNPRTSQTRKLKLQSQPVFFNRNSPPNRALSASDIGTSDPSRRTNNEFELDNRLSPSSSSSEFDIEAYNRRLSSGNRIADPEYSWKISGLTACSTTCGGGHQETEIVCVKRSSQVVVTDENCEHTPKPQRHTVVCNQLPCPARWHATEWGACSADCDGGDQSRTIHCKRRISSVMNLTVSSEDCASLPRPVTTQGCGHQPCYQWSLGNWTQCSTPCGKGERNREVTCQDSERNQGSESECIPRADKPATTQVCDLGSCGTGWFYTPWPTKCLAECGEGIEKRKLHCAGPRGEMFDDDKCSNFPKPAVERTCKTDIPCGGKWFTGPWGKCNTTCNHGVQTRDVTCMKTLGAEFVTVVAQENCVKGDKPPTERPCETLPRCRPEWYMKDWDTCSATCGTGYRTREVKCLDPKQRPSPECGQDEKPVIRESCNVHSCRKTEKPIDDSCKDSFSSCQVVVQARMCRYNYYKTVCCASCVRSGQLSG